jgi:hypothetical protein
MADATLWPAVVGGLIAIGGGLISPTVLHWLQSAEREKKLRAEKLEARRQIFH